jgi:hypothetical protein
MAFVAGTGNAISLPRATTHPVMGAEPVIAIDRFDASNSAIQSTKCPRQMGSEGHV